MSRNGRHTTSSLWICSGSFGPSAFVSITNVRVIGMLSSWGGPVSINPTSDIVLDVARAADPERSRAATARLERLGHLDRTTGAGFTAIVEDTGREPSSLLGQVALLGAKTVGSVPRGDARTEAAKGIEQLILQKLIECMLPKAAGTLFGHGTAGDVWRSMLAQQLATQLGSTIDLGVGRAIPSLTANGQAVEAANRHIGRRERADGAIDRKL